LSEQNLRVDGLEFAASVFDIHLPVNAALGVGDVDGPSLDFFLKNGHLSDSPTTETLARQTPVEKASRRLESAWFGSGARLKGEAWRLAREMAG